MTKADPKCPDCKGTGLTYRKAWAQVAGGPEIHPAIAARSPAYRTVVQTRCDCFMNSVKKKLEERNTSRVFSQEQVNAAHAAVLAADRIVRVVEDETPPKQMVFYTTRSGRTCSRAPNPHRKSECSEPSTCCNPE